MQVTQQRSYVKQEGVAEAVDGYRLISLKIYYEGEILSWILVSGMN